MSCDLTFGGIFLLSRCFLRQNCGKIFLFQSGWGRNSFYLVLPGIKKSPKWLKTTKKSIFYHYRLLVCWVLDHLDPPWHWEFVNGPPKLFCNITSKFLAKKCCERGDTRRLHPIWLFKETCGNQKFFWWCRGFFFCLYIFFWLLTGECCICTLVLVVLGS